MADGRQSARNKGIPQSTKKETNHDVLGYVDKDVENAYSAKMTNGGVETLLQVDLYKNELNTMVEEAR